MQKFRVNQYIELKLEGERTQIYVNGVKFRQCKFLLLEFPVEKISNLDDIGSIDEAVERFKNNEKRWVVYNHHTKIIPSGVEFFGHCSNIQAWAENDYDTRILHSNISFPLLKKLTDVGDPVAKKVFRNEIAKRFSSGSLSVMLYLIEEGYLNYYNDEELKFLLKDFNFNKIKDLKINKALHLYQTFAKLVGCTTKETFIKLLKFKYFMKKPHVNKIIKEAGLTRKEIKKMIKEELKEFKRYIAEVPESLNETVELYFSHLNRPENSIRDIIYKILFSRDLEKVLEFKYDNFSLKKYLLGLLNPIVHRHIS